MSFRIGKFSRDTVSDRFRMFCPTQSLESITHLDPSAVAASGKKLVLLDADNTLLPWRSHDFPPEILNWVAACKAAGLQLCLVSNARNRERLRKLCEILEVPSSEGKFKPSTDMFVRAVQKFGVTRDETLMVGDQILTDVLGANRAGIDAVLVKPMETREFVGTKVNRVGERLILYRLWSSLESSVDDLPPAPRRGLLKSKVVRQFLKFCLVGGLSFLIDYNVRMTLMFAVRWQGQLLSESVGNWMVSAIPMMRLLASKPADAFFYFAASSGAALAILNSFYWNRKWTFRISDPANRFIQFRRFLIISIVGLMLNVAISGGLNALIGGDPKNAARISTLVAAGVVAFWNFFGQRLYAFRVRSRE